jgi:hypothetical protein
VLDGLRTSGVVLRVNNSSNLMLAGAEIRDSPALGYDGHPSLSAGGAVQLSWGRNITIRDTTVSGSQSAGVLAFDIGGLRIERCRFLMNAANGINAGPVVPLIVTGSLFRDNATGTDSAVLSSPDPTVEVAGPDGRFYYATHTSQAGLAMAVKLTEFGYGTYDTRTHKVRGTYIDTDRRDGRVYRLKASHAPRAIFDGRARHDLMFTGNTVIEDATPPQALTVTYGSPYNHGFRGFAAVPYADRASAVWTDIQTLDAVIRGNRFVEPPTLGDSGDDAALLFEISNRIVVSANIFATTTGAGRFPLVTVDDSRHVDVRANTIHAKSALTVLFDQASRGRIYGDASPTDRLAHFRYLGNRVTGDGNRLVLFDLDHPKITYPTNPTAAAARAFLAAHHSVYIPVR